MRDSELERLKTEYRLQKREGRPVKSKEFGDDKLSAAKSKVKLLCQSLGIIPSAMRYIGAGIFIGLVRISPAMAISWLETRNANNRNEVRSKIAIMAEDICNNRWFVTHQGIAFDLDTSELNDGQHRLGAVVEANREVPMLVAMYSVAESRAKVDLVAARTFSDMERLVYGRHVDKAMVAVLRAFITGRSAVREMIGDDELRTVYLANQPALTFAYEQMIGRGKKTKITVGPAMAAIARAYAHVDRERLTRFCEVLHSGGYKEGCLAELMVVKLRDRLINGKGGVKSKATNLNIFAATQFTIDRFSKNKPSSKISETGEDVHPIPGQNGKIAF